MNRISKVKITVIALLLLTMLVTGFAGCSALYGGKINFKKIYDNYHQAQFSPQMSEYLPDSVVEESTERNAVIATKKTSLEPALSSAGVDMDIDKFASASPGINMYAYSSLISTVDKERALECVQQMNTTNQWQNVNISNYYLATYRHAARFDDYATVESAYFCRQDNQDILNMNIRSKCEDLTVRKKIVVNSTNNIVETYSEYTIKDSYHYEYKYTYHEEGKQFNSIEYYVLDVADFLPSAEQPYSKGGTITSYSFNGNDIEGFSYTFGCSGTNPEIGGGFADMNEGHPSITSIKGNKDNMTTIYASGDSYQLHNYSEGKEFIAGFCPRANDIIDVNLVFSHTNYSNIKRVFGVNYPEPPYNSQNQKLYLATGLELNDGTVIDPTFTPDDESYLKYHAPNIEHRITEFLYGGGVYLDTIIQFGIDKSADVAESLNSYLNETIHSQLELRIFDFSPLSSAAEDLKRLELFGKADLMSQSGYIILEVETKHILQTFTNDVEW